MQARTCSLTMATTHAAVNDVTRLAPRSLSDKSSALSDAESKSMRFLASRAAVVLRPALVLPAVVAVSFAFALLFT